MNQALYANMNNKRKIKKKRMVPEKKKKRIHHFLSPVSHILVIR
jgi:hypothetical protein